MDLCKSWAALNSKLGREITLILLFKALALGLIWVLFFSSPPVVHPGPQTTAAHLMGGGASHTQVPRGFSHD